MSFKYQGNDLTTLFMPNKDDNTPDTNYYINGVDISGLFQEYFNGSNADDIPYHYRGTKNLSGLFQKINVPLIQPEFTINGFNGTNILNLFNSIYINNINYRYLVISNDINNSLIFSTIYVKSNDRTIFFYIIGGGGGGASILNNNSSYIPTGGTGGEYLLIKKKVSKNFVFVPNTIGQGGIGASNPSDINTTGGQGGYSKLDIGFTAYTVQGGQGGILTNNLQNFPYNISSTGTKINPINTIGVCGTGGNYYSTPTSINGSGIHSNISNANKATFYGGGGGSGGMYDHLANTFTLNSGGNGYDGAIIIIYAE